ncbi:MAG TPA: hypothetical protein ENN27_04325 [Candidatus Atribacteria bacterium]|nr:hypothetical protein [Candidatus Atribacteria bacterium]
MLFRHKSKKEEKEKVIISYTQKLGIVCVQDLEKYIGKYKIIKCYILVPHPPHTNVIEYAENINQIEIVISPDLKQETEKIKKLYPGSTMEIINLEDFGEKNMMRDAI